MIQTAVQQIMLGKVTGTKEQAERTLDAIRNAGYDGIELNHFMIHPSNLAVRVLTSFAGMPTGKGGALDWPALMKAHSLTIPSLHCDLGTLEKKTSSVLEDVHALGTDKVVITGMYYYDYRSSEKVKDLAKRLNEAGRTLKEDGVSLLYHNHNIELLRTEEGKLAFDTLMEETDTEYLNFELDSYWLADAGANPVQWMKMLGPRMKLWHINDRGNRVRSTPITPILRSDSMELGYGNMDLPALAKQAKENGISAVILESHKNWAEGSPIRSLELSAPYLHNLI